MKKGRPKIPSYDPGVAQKVYGKKMRESRVKVNMDDSSLNVWKKIEKSPDYLKALDEVMPLVEYIVNEGDLHNAFNKASKLAFLRKIQLMLSGNSEKIRDKAATDILHTAGYKPVEKSMNVNVDYNSMSKEELNRYIESKMKLLNPDQKKEFGKLLNGTVVETTADRDS